MAKKKEETGLSVIGDPLGAGPSISDVLQQDQPSIKDIQKAALRGAGMLGQRTKYGSTEERKEARKARGKAWRKARRTFLEDKGLLKAKVPKLTKEQKKAKMKGARVARNIWLRANPEEAAKLGFDITRFRV